VFFPAVEERRNEFSYTGKLVLLMDGLGAHHTEKFLQECQERIIDVIFLVPTARTKLSRSISSRLPC
jgi:hypothetical protein